MNWTYLVSSAPDRLTLLEVTVAAREAGELTEELAAYARLRLGLMSTRDRIAAEAHAIRADERVKVLREIRNTVARADRNCHEVPGRTGDPWDWGPGGMHIVKYLSWKLGEARRAAGLEPERKGGQHGQGSRG